MNRVPAFVSGLSLILGFAAQNAGAADLPTLKSPSFEPPSQDYSWTGVYGDLNAGTGIADPTGSLSAFTAPLAVSVASGAAPRNLNVGPDGAIAGAGLGYRWQTGAWVLGVESDFQGSLVAGTSSAAFPGGGGSVPTFMQSSERLLWFGTSRARVGWLVEPNILFYGTGGVAYGQSREAYSLVGNPPATGVFTGAANATRIGWTAGGGVEWKMTKDISFTSEYLRVDLGSSSLVATAPGFPGSVLTYRFHNAYNIVRSGLNYQFDLFGAGPAVSKY
jgi:outer membrane immunogenic protein